MDKKELLNRIRRVQGQIAGVEKMIEEGRACLDSVQQIAAARSAMAKIGVELLKSEAEVCYKDPKRDDFDKVIDNLFKLT